MGKTSIEWVKDADGAQGETYNPIRGCSRISPGCGGGGSFSGTPDQRGGCYAEGIAARFSGPGQPFHGFATMTEHGPRWTGKVALLDDKIREPLTRKKPTTWFLSMFDLFHEALTDEQIAAVVGVMAVTPRHTYQILTKRADRLPRWSAWAQNYVDGANMACRLALQDRIGIVGMRGEDSVTAAESRAWPLPNVHLGVSVESAKFKDRIDHLRKTPAAVRFLSIEPLLEDVGTLDLTGIHQVIVGAESGHHARPMREDWVRSIRDQAIAQGVKMFYKQRLEGGRKVSLPMLDGRQWAEMP